MGGNKLQQTSAENLIASILSMCILSVLSIYWAVLFHVELNISSLVVYVVDFDGQTAPYTFVTPLLGPMITQMTEEMQRSPIPHLGYVTMPPSAFNNDPLQVRQAVYDQKAWAAIVVNPNATALLQQAVQQGNTSYEPLGACQVTFVSARDQDTHNSYILPQLNSLQTEIASSFGTMWTAMVLQNTSISLANLQRAPQALNPAIGFSQYSLRPFAPAVMTPAVTIGLIYLIIISFFSFSFYLPIHMKLLIPEGHAPLKFWQFIIWRWSATITAYGLMSLAYSLVSLGFQIPFANPTAATTEVAENPNAFGKATFVVYWMINYVGMIALGLACENVAMLIGQPWTAIWLIFWVITNVSTSFYSLELAPKFYYWGYAWPLHNGEIFLVRFSSSIIGFPCTILSSETFALTRHPQLSKHLARHSSTCTRAWGSTSVYYSLGVQSTAPYSLYVATSCAGRANKRRRKKPRLVRKNDVLTFLLFALDWDVFERQPRKGRRFVESVDKSFD